MRPAPSLILCPLLLLPAITRIVHSGTSPFSPSLAAIVFLTTSLTHNLSPQLPPSPIPKANPRDARPQTDERRASNRPEKRRDERDRQATRPLSDTTSNENIPSYYPPICFCCTTSASPEVFRARCVRRTVTSTLCSPSYASLR
jgi:hypothetical protein